MSTYPNFLQIRSILIDGAHRKNTLSDRMRRMVVTKIGGIAQCIPPVTLRSKEINATELIFDAKDKDCSASIARYVRCRTDYSKFCPYIISKS